MSHYKKLKNNLGAHLVENEFDTKTSVTNVLKRNTTHHYMFKAGNHAPTIQTLQTPTSLGN